MLMRILFKRVYGERERELCPLLFVSTFPRLSSPLKSASFLARAHSFVARHLALLALPLSAGRKTASRHVFPYLESFTTRIKKPGRRFVRPSAHVVSPRAISPFNSIRKVRATYQNARGTVQERRKDSHEFVIRLKMNFFQ